ncbi:MAG: acyltransferase, partial [Planctomycetota bacterium]
HPTLNPLGWCANGWIGVDLFFVLSGFLLGRKLLQQLATGTLRVGDYIRSRIKRIVPAFYAALLISVVIACLSGRQSGASIAYQSWANLLFCQDFIPTSVNVAFWSLGVEMKFYLALPFLLMTIADRSPQRQVAWIAAIVCISPLLRGVLWIADGGQLDHYGAAFWRYRAPLWCCLDGLGVGVLVAAMDRIPAWSRRIRQFATPLFWCGTLMILWSCTSGPLMNHICGLEAAMMTTWLSVGFGCMVAAVIQNHAPRFLSFRLPGIIARHSYAIYLTHMWWIDPIGNLCRRCVPGYTEMTPEMQFILFMPPFLIASYASAWWLHYLVERPMMSRGRGRSTATVTQSASANVASEDA